MKVEDVMINERICLMPMKWQEFYQAIQQAYPVREIPKPLILAGWNFTNDTHNRDRFFMHLEYAISAGVTNNILDQVTGDDWYCSIK
jgi:hypothetical protein